MRVAYLINQYPAISHTFIRREIHSLEEQGVVVERFALRGWDSALVDPLDIAELTRTRHTLKDGAGRLISGAFGFAARQPAAFWRGLKLALAMSRNAARPWPFHLIYLAHACRIMTWLRGSGVTHLHAHFGTNSTEIAALVHALGGPGYSFTVHGSEVHDDARQNRLDAKLSGARFAAVVCSYIGSQLMRRTSSEDWPKIHTVHCGLPKEAFTDTPAAFPARPTFLCIGRLSGEKGHLILLEAFARARPGIPGARLVLAGDGPLRAVIEDRIAALGIGASVEILGWVTSDQVRAALGDCHALVQPSFNEGLPVVIMEAMAEYRPVIATYIGGIPELVQPGKTGWLVPAGDVAALAGALAECAALPVEDLQALGAAGFERVRVRHDVDTEAARLKALFAGEGINESGA